MNHHVRHGPTVARPPRRRPGQRSTPVRRVSFEFFPPKTAEMEEQLWQAIKRLEPLRAALRLGHLRRRRLDPRAHPRDGARASAHETAPGAGGPSDLRRRRRATRSTRSRATIGRPASAISWRCAAIRRPGSAAPTRRIPAATPMPPTWWPASSASPISRSASRPIPRPIPRRRSAGHDLDNLKRKLDAGATPRDHPVLLRRRRVPALPRPRAAPAGIDRADRAGHPAGDQFRPGGEVQRPPAAPSIPAWLARACSTGSTTTPRRAGWSPPRVAAEQCRRLQANGVARVPLLHAEPRRPDRRDLPHPRRSRAAGAAFTPRRRTASARTEDRRPMAHFLDYLADRVLLCDGAHGHPRAGARPRRRARLSRPGELHRDPEREPPGPRARDPPRLSRGRLPTWSRPTRFGGSPITLGEFGLQDKAFEINRRAAELAREAVAEFAARRPRRASCSARSGRAPSCRRSAISPTRRWKTRWRSSAPGLIAGGVDAILIETCQDPLQIKAAVNGAKRARAEAGKDIADLRPGDGRDDRHAAGRRRHRRRRDRHPRARRAGDRPELRHRPAEMAEHVKWLGDELAGPDLGAAQCRPAGAGRRPARTTR